jgi:putative endonuclease
VISLLYRLADAARHRARRQRDSPELAQGRRGEDLAHRFLRRQGYVVVARNYRPRAGAGEIDLVAWERGTLVFVEVKTRAGAAFGAPERAVDADKERDLTRVAADYARRAGVPWDRVRFDVVSILLEGRPQISLQRDAFRVAGRR